MMIEQHLEQLIQDLELESLPPKKEDGYHLSLTPDIAIKLKELDPGLFLFTRLGPCPQQKKEELFILLMKANFLGQGTGGATIGMENDENFLTLSLALPYEMNYKRFKDALEDFVNFSDYWKAELKRHQSEADNSVFS